MDRNELMKHLAQYGDAVKSQTANTQHFMDIKNKIRQAYDAGNLDKGLMKELGDKASHAFKNMGKAANLESLPETIAAAGGKVGQVEGMASKFGKLSGLLKGAGKALPMVAGIAALAPTLSKASEGDLRGAATSLGEAAVDMSPLSYIKPQSLGEGSDRPDLVPMDKRPDWSKYQKVDDSPRQDKPVRYQDLKKLFQGVKKDGQF